MSRLFKAGAHRLGRAAKTSLAVVGFGTTVGVGYYYWDTQKFLQEDSSNNNQTKRVLVLPFHRFQIVKKQDDKNLVKLLQSQRSNLDNKIEEVDVQELVKVINEATSDPSIVAIYGEFGHGRSFSGGLADAEEVRNALRVFRESHRVHHEPNMAYETVLKRENENSEARPLYAYSDTFESAESPSNPDYYLASIFTHIHLQQQGTLNLAGFSSSVPFLKDTLKKYGAKVHVYKHGPFKNAPNSLTDSGLNKAHRQNIETYLFALNAGRCHDIAMARRKTLESMMATKRHDDVSSNLMWALVQNGGSFTAVSALKMGFVDYICPRSPLDALLEYNDNDDETTNNDKKESDTTSSSKETDMESSLSSKEQKQQRLKETWGSQTDFDSFKATKKVTFSEYRQTLSKRRQLDHRKERLQKAAERHPALEWALTSIASTGVLNLPDKKKQAKASNDNDKKQKKPTSEKIALLSVNGGIDAKKVRKLAPIIRKIKYDKDVKCVIVQVDSPGGTIDASEALYQDLKDLPQNVVFSFGNVCASGGYYIACAGDRIFASKNTITGSIGVYGIRFDFTGVAASYGVKFGHVATSEFALANNPFHPVTKQMHANSGRSVDRAYQRFKEVVSTGRSLPEDYLESIAQGRVWTGEQANQNGLVDEIGGLNRAVAFCQNNYTTNGDARVDVYTGEEGYFQSISKLLSRVSLLWQATENTNNMSLSQPVFPGQFLQIGSPLPNFLPPKAFDIFLTTDENAAIQSMLSTTTDEE